MLLISLLLRHVTLGIQRLLDRTRIWSLSLGSSLWLLAGQGQGERMTDPMVLWALGVGPVVAGVTVGMWHLARVAADSVGRRGLRVPLFVLSVVFCSALAGLALWNPDGGA